MLTILFLVEEALQNLFRKIIMPNFDGGKYSGNALPRERNRHWLGK